MNFPSCASEFVQLAFLMFYVRSLYGTCCTEMLNLLEFSVAHITFLVISLASIAKKRPVHYDSILPALLEFDPNFRTSTGGHAASIQYAVRIALLGFLRCTHASIYEVSTLLPSIMFTILLFLFMAAIVKLSKYLVTVQ